MERLTEWKDDKKMLAKPKFSGDFGSSNILCRLAEYEDREETLEDNLVRVLTENSYEEITDNRLCYKDSQTRLLNLDLAIHLIKEVLKGDKV